MKKMFDWTILGGATIIPRSLKTTGNEKYFQDRPNIFYFKIIYDPEIFANNRFSKIRSIKSGRDGLGQNVKIYSP